ncbi:hypothetical protein BPO_0532 [Bergeyella porcorum]|uniref:Uncharacterized protein n=1 Tax=Bergeyella porcorum TaxID=1735111 RepID=A0AAU0EZL5_9FLAO
MGKTLELVKGSKQYAIVYNYLGELTKYTDWQFGIEEHSNVAYLYQNTATSINVVHILIGEKLTIGVSHLLYWICLKQVNEIYKDFMLHNNIQFVDKFYSGDDLETIKNLPNFEKNESWLDRSKPSYKIGTEESFKTINDYLDSYCVPFFSEINTVQDVNDKILDAVSFEEYDDYILGNTALKVLIIFRICNNPKYNEYKKYLENLISEQLVSPEYSSYMSIIQDQQTRIESLHNYFEAKQPHKK